MDDFTLRAYVLEAHKQCQFSLFAVTRMNECLPIALAPLFLPNMSRQERDAMTNEQTKAQFEVFRSIHSFLTHSSNLSKLLWPETPRRKQSESDDDFAQRKQNVEARGRLVREALDVSSGAHPLRSRQLRNHLDHFDDRLDAWSATQGTRSFINDVLAPIGSIGGEGCTAADTMRWFDYTTNMMHFRGDKYDLQAMCTAIETVRDKATRLLNPPNRAS